MTLDFTIYLTNSLNAVNWQQVVHALSSPSVMVAAALVVVVGVLASRGGKSRS